MIRPVPLVVIATAACSATNLTAPTSTRADFGNAEAGMEGVSVAVTDTRAGDAMVVVHWTSGRPAPLGLIVGEPVLPPRVARTRLFVSEEGPTGEFRLVAERSDSGPDTTAVGPLTNGVTYAFRAAVYDSAGNLFGLTRPAMTTPGPVVGAAFSVPAPQADEPWWLSNLSWSPDGRRLALIRRGEEGAGPDLYVFNVEDRRFRAVTSFSTSSPSYRLGSVAWSPDGASLAFSYSPSATYYLTDYRIWRVGVDGSGMRSISSGRVDADGVWVTADELLFTRGRHVEPGSSGAVNVPEVYRLRLTPPVGETAVTSGDTLHKYHLAYSPVTDEIVFSGGVSGRSLYAVGSAGGAVERLTDQWAPGYPGDIHPAWTPDGAAILFASNRSGHYEIWSLDRQSGQIHQVTGGLEPGVERLAPRPSPDGRWLAYLEIERKDPSSGELGSYRLALRQVGH